MTASARVAALALLLTCALLTGCAREETVSLGDWTLRTADGVDHPLTLPFHADPWLGARPGRYTLSTRATVPPGWRGQALTLAIPSLEAPVALTVDGEDAASVDEGLLPGSSYTSAHAYRIDAAHTRSGEVALELTVESRSRHGGWIDTVPRLSATTTGDRVFLAVRLVDGPLALATYAVVSMMGFTYFVLFFFDRRRTAHLWFALQASGVAYYTLEVLGLPQSLIGLYGFSAIAAPWSGVAGMRFVHAYFGTSPPRGALRALSAVILIAGTLATGPFAEGGMATRVCALIAVGNVPYIMLLLTRADRAGRDRFSARILLAGWALLVVTIAPDIVYGMGLGELAQGAHTSVVGFGLFAVAQAIVLGRDHIRSLKVADARVAELEQSAHENALLGDELRRQIADRSQRLAEALARIGAVPVRVVELAPGDEVHGRYRAIRALGAGGMGAVYEVERLTDGRRLALKVLMAASTGVALARLAREAHVAALASHPNLVAILDVDVSEAGALYIVMELVDGAPLHDLSGRYGDVAWARGVLQQVARGVAALHAHGVVHRDLKPGNVLLTRAGVAKIADFGIARLGADSGPINPMASTQAPAPLTETGVLIGTPLYMAPELAMGSRAAGPPSDVFSFGVIAFELLAGKLPFATPPALAGLAGRALQRPRLEVAGLPESIVTLVARCLDADPDGRPSASAIVAVLEAWPA